MSPFLVSKSGERTEKFRLSLLSDITGLPATTIRNDINLNLLPFEDKKEENNNSRRHYSISEAFKLFTLNKISNIGIEKKIIATEIKKYKHDFSMVTCLVPGGLNFYSFSVNFENGVSVSMDLPSAFKELRKKINERGFMVGWTWLDIRKGKCEYLEEFNERTN